MFTKEEDIQNIKQLIAEVKQYVALQKEYVGLELTEKIAIILSTLIEVILLIILGMVALFYFSFTIAYFLAQYVGLIAAYGIITAFLVLLTILVYHFRQKCIVSPIVKTISKILLSDNNNSKK